MWLEEFREHARPLVEAACRFLGTRKTETVFCQGVEGFQRLALWTEQWCYSAEESDDFVWVEGSGALLGLLLLQYFPESTYASKGPVHRLRLGTHGWFNPFDAMQRIIDDDHPRLAFARELSLAESEAQGKGPVSRVLRTFERLLAKHRPDVRIVEVFDATVKLDFHDAEVDLRRVVAATRDQSIHAVERATLRIIQMLPPSGDSQPLTHSVSEVLPRLVGKAFLARLTMNLESRQAGLFMQPSAGDLHVGLIFPESGRSRFITRREVLAWGLDDDAVITRAVENLALRSKCARFCRTDTNAGPLVFAQTGDALDSARLLLPNLHDVLAPELGSPFIVGVPHRDTLLAAPAGSRTGIHQLSSRVQDLAARAPHPISTQLFMLDKDGFRPLRSVL